MLRNSIIIFNNENGLLMQAGSSLLVFFIENLQSGSLYEEKIRTLENPWQLNFSQRHIKIPGICQSDFADNTNFISMGKQAEGLGMDSTTDPT